MEIAAAVVGAVLTMVAVVVAAVSTCVAVAGVVLQVVAAAVSAERFVDDLIPWILDAAEVKITVAARRLVAFVEHDRKEKLR